jgi:diadenosine tetraphosphate (Ap4A) HIT family hydrolase
VLRRLYDSFRLNIADIGNKAAQLHIHIVARHEDDPLWPSVVWSRDYERYDEAGMAARLGELQAGFAELPGFTLPG